MSSTFTLKDGQKTITIYPEYDSKLGARMDRSINRFQRNTVQTLQWAVYPEYDLNVNYITKEDADLINDWWLRRVSLFFTHTVDGTVMQSQQCKLSGDSLPLPSIHINDVTRYKGQLRIRVLEPITKPKEYSLFCGCESVGGSGGLFRIGSGDYNPSSDAFSDAGMGIMPTLNSSYTMVGSHSFQAICGAISGAWYLAYTDRWDNSLNILVNNYFKPYSASGNVHYSVTLEGSGWTINCYRGNSSFPENVKIETNVDSIFTQDYFPPRPVPQNKWFSYQFKVDLQQKKFEYYEDNILIAKTTLPKVPQYIKEVALMSIFTPYNTSTYAVFFDGLYQTANFNDNLFNIRYYVDYPL